MFNIEQRFTRAQAACVIFSAFELSIQNEQPFPGPARPSILS
jgi:hypothetical protein